MKEIIPKYVQDKERQILLYLKQIGAIETQKRGFKPTNKFRNVYARYLTHFIVERNGLSMETMQDATVLSITTLSGLSGEKGIDEDMLVEASQVMLVWVEQFFKEIESEVENLRKDIIASNRKSILS